MEKLLNAIASKLSIRITVEKKSKKNLDGFLISTMSVFDHKDVSDEVRDLFKTELNNHLFSKVEEIEVGEYVDYGFNYGPESSLGTLMAEANDNLAEVLLQLPPLNDGECYDFPCETYICFALTGKDEQGSRVKPNIVCSWILEAYQNYL